MSIVVLIPVKRPLINFHNLSFSPDLRRICNVKFLPMVNTQKKGGDAVSVLKLRKVASPKFTGVATFRNPDRPIVIYFLLSAKCLFPKVEW